VTAAFATAPAPWATERSKIRMHPDDYRWEGVIAGGIGGAVFGTVVGIGMCGFDSNRPTVECVPAGFLGLTIGAVLGGGLGGLVGGLIPKH
jgi:hypothetical protein